METLEEAIRNDPHIVEIVPAEGWEVPDLREVDFEAGFGEFATVVREFIPLFEEYLKFGYFKDDFPDHAERRNWINELERKYGQAAVEYLRKNALRFNTFNYIGNMVFLMEERAVKPYPRLRENIEAMRKMGFESWKTDLYDALSPDKKIELVRKYKNYVFEVLRSLKEE